MKVPKTDALTAAAYEGAALSGPSRPRADRMARKNRAGGETLPTGIVALSSNAEAIRGLMTT